MKGAGASDQDVAMVLDVSGTSNPKAEAFSMLQDGARFDLGADGEIELVHLNSCELIRLKGGIVEVHTLGFDADSEVILHSEEECPVEARLGTETSPDGVILRNRETTTGGVTLRARNIELIPDRPILVLDRSFTSAEIIDLDKRLRLHIWSGKERILRWPVAKDGLKRKTRYILLVTFLDGSSRYIELLVNPEGGQRRLPVILRSD